MIQWLLPLFGLAIFGAFWCYTCNRINHALGLSRVGPDQPGVLLRESRWGSAMINGVMFGGTVKLFEYERGWLLQISRIWGGGKLWLPREFVRFGEPYTVGFVRQLARNLGCGGHAVCLYDRLAKLVADSH